MSERELTGLHFYGTPQTLRTPDQRIWSMHLMQCFARFRIDQCNQKGFEQRFWLEDHRRALECLPIVSTTRRLAGLFQRYACADPTVCAAMRFRKEAVMAPLPHGRAGTLRSR